MTTRGRACDAPRELSVPLMAPLPGEPTCALTVDVEDWFQSCVDLDAPVTERVVRNLERLLVVLDAASVRATFFVQGLVADAFPGAVRELYEAGHEIQSHGHTHKSLARMSPAELRDELRRGRAAVEDAAGVTVTAFRAPDFSIGRDNLWALETIAGEGFEIDSSIFPRRTRRYGIDGWSLGPHRLELGDGSELLEVPVSVWDAGRIRLPVGGGGYVRLAPLPVLERCLRQIATRRPVVFYCHPYEFNADELAEYRGRVSARYLGAQGLGRRAFVRRLKALLGTLTFGRLDETLMAWGVLDSQTAV